MLSFCMGGFGGAQTQESMYVCKMDGGDGMGVDP